PGAAARRGGERVGTGTAAPAPARPAAASVRGGTRGPGGLVEPVATAAEGSVPLRRRVEQPAARAPAGAGAWQRALARHVLQRAGPGARALRAFPHPAARSAARAA